MLKFKFISDASPALNLDDCTGYSTVDSLLKDIFVRMPDVTSLRAGACYSGLTAGCSWSRVSYVIGTRNGATVTVGVCDKVVF